MLSKNKRIFIVVASVVAVAAFIVGIRLTSRHFVDESTTVAADNVSVSQSTTTATTTTAVTTTTTTTTTATTTTTTKKQTVTKPTNNTTDKDKTTAVKTTQPTTTQVYNADREAYLNSIKGNKKLIALTFDDGPSIYTPKLLDNLNKYNARVTFFVAGYRVDDYSKTLKRAYDMGNEIGSHTYSHENLVKLKPKELESQIKKTNNAVSKVIGVTPGIMRPPYGSYDNNVRSAAGVPIILWNIDTLDWKYRNKDKVCQSIVDNAHDGAIILMHDLYETTVDGVIMAMDKLQHEGYAFVTVSELAYLKDKDLQSGKVYSSIK